jgi:cellulose synthase/poly-beta-1,6-N-acetylglucosamine synthase-like glycosyltransferase
MLTVLVWSVAALSLPILVATAVLVVEIIASLLPVRRDRNEIANRPRCAVLIPAHNEETGIGRTIAALLPQLLPGDRILAVADNCTDATAAVVRSAGAEVVERTDPVRRGKGYALDFGVRALEADAPAVAVIVDADCIVEPESLDRLVRTAATTGRPVQAAYQMQAPADGGTRAQLSAFLFALKNMVRPRGLARLGMPCLLTGTGMAFPWDLLRNAPLASGNIVEDMQLGIDLALSGRAPLFCPTACVRSELPAARTAAASQRTRWVHGHLRTLVTQTPRLFAAAFRRGRYNLLGLALELSVPPLSLLILLGVFAALALTAGWLLGGPGLPAAVVVAAGGAAGVAIFSAWVRFGREFLPASGLLAVPCELLNRLPILFRYLLRPQGAWVRTARRTAD